MQILKQRRIETLSLPVAERKKRWLVPFLKSYLVVFFGYMAMYLIRKNFTVSQNDLIEQYGFTKTDLGKIGFWFSMVYGIGKTAVSYLGHGRETKNFVSLLLILSSLAMFGFGSVVGSLNGMILLFALNGLFQSAGAPFSYSTIINWTAQKHRGRFLALWNVSHYLGGALAAVIATFGAQHVFNGDIRGMFFFPAAIALVIGFIGLFFGADSPEAYGLGRAEDIFEENISVIQKEYERAQPSRWETFKKYILTNPFIWCLCLSNVFLYIVCIGVDQWGLIYAKEVLGFSKETATQGFALFQVGAFFGAFIWGYLSDVTRGRSSLLSLISMGLILVFLRIYQTAPTENIFLTSLFVLGFLIFGPLFLIGVSGVFFVPKSAVSVADGFRGTFGYLLGDSFAKLGIGMMADNKVVFGLQGWDGTFTAMYFATIGGMACLIFVARGEDQKIKLTSTEAKNSAHIS